MNRKQRRAAKALAFVCVKTPLVSSTFNEDKRYIAGWVEAAVQDTLEQNLADDRLGLMQVRSVLHDELTIVTDIPNRLVLIGFSEEMPEPGDHKITQPFRSTPAEWEAQKQRFRAMRH